MAIELSAGEHEVSLEYETPWLKEGAVLSLVGVAAAAALTAVWAVSAKKSKTKA